MRAFIIQISIGLLTLVVPEVWKDGFEWLRRTPYWRLVQLAVVLWILIVIWLAIPWSNLARWMFQHRLVGTILSAMIAAVFIGGAFLCVSYSDVAKQIIGNVTHTRPATPADDDPFKQLHKLFMSDFEGPGSLRIGVGTEMERHWPDGRKEKLGELKLYDDFGTNSKFLAAYFPLRTDLYELCRDFATKCRDYIAGLEQNVETKSKDPAEPFWQNSKDLQFTGRVYVYYEGNFTVRQLADLEDVYNKQNLSPQFRGFDYSDIRRWQAMSAKQPSPTPDKEGPKH
jgi:hypothetical protein